MRTINRIVSVATIVVLAAITGCAAQGGGSSAPATAASSAARPAAGAAPAAEAVITIKNFKYEVPSSVKPGAMVTVTNADSAPHTLTAKDKGAFDVEVPAGATVILQASREPGNYGIVCTFHPQMSGTLVVK